MTGGSESSTWHEETKITMVQIAQKEVKRLGDSYFLSPGKNSGLRGYIVMCVLCLFPLSLPLRSHGTCNRIAHPKEKIL